MRTLVTGAAGFVGSHLAERLVSAGHEVTCLIRPGSLPRWLAGSTSSIVDCGMESPRDMADVVGQVDAIFHVAGVTKARTPDGYYRGNVDTTRNLVEAIRLYGVDVKVVVGVSSQAAVGPHPGPHGLDDFATPAPVSHYGRSKLEAEQLLRGLNDSRAVGVVRPPMVYGPRDYAFLPLYSSAKKRIFPVPGSRQTLMSIVHVLDLVQGITSLADALLNGRIESGGSYFISGQIASWDEIGQAIGDAVGHSPFIITMPFWAIHAVAMVNGVFARLGLPTNHLMPDKYREAKQPGWVCIDTRAREELGYAPRISLEDGMRSTVAWCRDNNLL